MSRARPFEQETKVLLVMPKNAVTEQRVTSKRVASDRNSESEYLDMREFWFKDGPTSEPLPTSRGVMVRRDQLPRLIKALLGEAKAGELEDGGDELAALLARARGKT